MPRSDAGAAGALPASAGSRRILGAWQANATRLADICVKKAGAGQGAAFGLCICAYPRVRPHAEIIAMFQAMPIADLSAAKGGVATAPIQQVQALLTTCLARLDALDAQVAAAHLSACLDTLRQDFNPD